MAATTDFGDVAAKLKESAEEGRATLAELRAVAQAALRDVARQRTR